MKLKQIVGLSLIIFVTSIGMIMFVGLVLVRPATSLAVMTDPVSGSAVQGNATAPDPTNGGQPVGNTGGAAVTPAPVAAATAAPVATKATPAPVVATAAPGAKTPAPTVAPVKTPAPTPAPTPKPVVYCGGATPCYGPTTLAQHASVSGSCWGYNLNWVIDLTAYAPAHPNGPSNVLSSILCGKNIAGALSGSTNVSGTHNHTTATKTNASSSPLVSYVVGYYDATKP
jgi:hypothetical protein